MTGHAQRHSSGDHSDSYDAAGTAAAGDAAHVAAGDPHPTYETSAEAAAKVAAHAGAADPHGDRAYADSDVSTHAAIAGAHHNPVTIGADGEHSLAAQVLSGVDGSSSQKGHVSIGATAPPAVGTTGSAGAASTEAASKFHVHAHEAAHLAHDTIWDAKGDLVAGTGADTAAKIGVGTDGFRLMADAASTPGMKWAPPSFEPTSVVATGGASQTLDASLKSVFDITLTANITYTFSGAVSGTACSFTLIQRQNGTGGWTVAWPASVKWVGGVAPTISNGASAVDIYSFVSVDGGTTWYGFVIGQAMA